MTDKAYPEPEYVVDLCNVTKIYGSGHISVTAIDDVSLHVEKGEIVVLMGPSGSGKTTLIQVIGALLSPTDGEIHINGRSLTGLSSGELARLRLEEMGFVFQNPNLLSALTASKNVEIVLNMAGTHGSEAEKFASELLELLGLGERLNHKPSQLSGGEQQRVAIARAIANNPQLILADEPTANLDSKTGHKIIELLRKIAKDLGKTVIIATHDLRLRDLADRVLWLEDGELRVRWSKGFMIDPVCLMLVDEDTDLTFVHEDKKHYFCSSTCRNNFMSDVHRYEGRGSWQGMLDEPFY